MSWDDPRTDMAHCIWCTWDLYKKDAIDMMHPECKVKNTRRNKMRGELRLLLRPLGVVNPDRENLLTDLCLRIEKALDKEQSS